LATRSDDPSRQRGTVLPLVAIALLAIIAMAGLAIDSSHAFVNKTRLQNMADAAVLAAAKVYDESADTILSTAAANSTFGLNTDGSGNFEIDSEYDSGNISVVVQYSETLNPFVSTGIGPYVRVIASGFNMATGLSSVLGINTIGIGASAVAGPSPTIDTACNIAPMVACANDPDPLAEYYGFDEDALMVLKPSPGDHGDVGPGNYKLLQLDPSGPGGADLRVNMAGIYDACASTDQDVETQPGFLAGPTSQGFNTRFGEYNGPVSRYDYPPDLITQESAPPLDTQQVEQPPGSGTYVDQICMGPCNDPVAPANQVILAYDELGIFNYLDYVARTESGPFDEAADGIAWRRILAMPVANCTGDQAGQTTLDVIGFACYFMLQRMDQSAAQTMFGQFVDGCLAGGSPGPNPGAGAGPYIIQLYKDPDSGDS
jgi:hypothetical protein